MPDNIYVAGFPYKTTKEELASLFAACGTVVSAKVILDRETGRPTGFGFVEMSTLAEAKAAVAKLNGTDIGGRKLFVVEARPQKEREERPDRRPASPAAPARALRPGDPGFVERRSGKDRRGSGVPPLPPRPRRPPPPRRSAPGSPSARNPSRKSRSKRSPSTRPRSGRKSPTIPPRRSRGKRSPSTPPRRRPG
ncbi:MAG: RNA-binding protein [Elusimicrobiota bacterium]|nr:MAG: RNA-binding protein [Elusimicrobiota bacterium]